MNWVTWLFVAQGVILGAALFFAAAPKLWRRIKNLFGAKPKIPESQQKEDNDKAQKESDFGVYLEVRAPQDSDVERNRFVRWIVFFETIFLSAVIPILALGYYGWSDNPILLRLSIIIGELVSTGVLWLSLDRFLIYNPEWRGYLTNNMFTGKNVVYGPGLHLALPWERRNRNKNFPLDLFTTPFMVAVPTKTSEVTAHATYSFAPSLRRLNQFDGAGPDGAHETFVSYITSFLSTRFSALDAEEARTQQQSINNELRKTFMGAHMPTRLEGQGGVNTSLLVVKRITLPLAVQKTRDAQDEASRMRKVVAELLGITPEEVKKLSHEQYMEALNRAMATSDNANMQFHAYDFGSAGNLPGIIAAIASLVGKGKPSSEGTST